MRKCPFFNQIFFFEFFYYFFINFFLEELFYEKNGVFSQLN
jgi:hypothetical protein